MYSLVVFPDTNQAQEPLFKVCYNTIEECVKYMTTSDFEYHTMYKYGPELQHIYQFEKINDEIRFKKLGIENSDGTWIQKEGTHDDGPWIHLNEYMDVVSYFGETKTWFQRLLNYFKWNIIADVLIWNILF